MTAMALSIISSFLKVKLWIKKCAVTFWPYRCGQKKMPRKMKTQPLVSPSWHCVSTLVSFGQGFLSKEQCWQHCNIPTLASADFYLFPRLKSALKGRCFRDAADITKNATDKLKRFSQNGFHECSQNLYTHWQKCIVVQGDYFEGNVA